MRRGVSLLPVVSLWGLAVAWAGTGTWTVSPAPNRGSLSNFLNGIAVTPEGSAWAVGHSYDQQLASYRTLAERWDGSRWQIVSSPNVGTGYNDLYGVATTGSTSALAVGYSRQTAYTSARTLAVKWDGSSWRTTVTPNPGSTDNVLYGVAALASDNAWAVGGYYDASGVGRPLITHWDGTRWSLVDAPRPSTSFSILQSVAASGPNDVWAGGYASLNGRYSTLLMHWNGAAWSVVPSPNVGTKANRIRAVAVLPTGEAWAVGDSQTSLILHWDGVSWSVVDRPLIGTYSTLWGVTAAQSNDVWAVGYYRDGAIEPLIMHWDGGTWTLGSATVNAANPWLTSVSGGTGAGLWAAGTAPNGTADRVLILKGPGR